MSDTVKAGRMSYSTIIRIPVLNGFQFKHRDGYNQIEQFFSLYWVISMQSAFHTKRKCVQLQIKRAAFILHERRPQK